MTRTPESQALSDVCTRLEGAGIAYMLTGSIAMSYYARPCMTRDIDLVVALDMAGAARLTGVLGADYHADAISGRMGRAPRPRQIAQGRPK